MRGSQLTAHSSQPQFTGGIAHTPLTQFTLSLLQQSAATLHESPSSLQTNVFVSTHTPESQKPEQHSKPAWHAPPPFVGMHAASAQKPRMFVVSSSCPSRKNGGWL